MDLNGTVALIVGGARMGGDLGVALAEKGARILLGYRRSKSAAQLARRQIESAGGEARVMPVRLNSDANAAGSVKAAIRFWGRLDIVVNMASTYEFFPLKKMTGDRWAASFESNLNAGMRLVKAAAPELVRRSGRIVNFSDWVAASGRPRYTGYPAYYTAKKAVVGWTESLALELAPRVLVNAIAPGPILPPKGMSAKEKRAVAAATPLHRWGGTMAIAKAVVFLCETDFVTGECVRVDGGRHLH